MSSQTAADITKGSNSTICHNDVTSTDTNDKAYMKDNEAVQHGKRATPTLAESSSGKPANPMEHKIFVHLFNLFHQPSRPHKTQGRNIHNRRGRQGFAPEYCSLQNMTNVERKVILLHVKSQCWLRRKAS